MTTTRVGVISDTHNLLRPAALRFLEGCGRIVHCGDICSPAVIDALAAIAPVSAVRGNNDQGAWAQSLPESDLVSLGGVLAYLIHDVAQIDLDPVAAGAQLVLYGHSHQPCIEQRGDVLFMNPGSAGPRRFKLPICVGELLIADGAITPRIVELAPD